MMPNYYQILELPYNASASDIKRAYREKAKNCHPDISRSDQAKKEFQLLNQAYSILSDAEKRKKYDLILLYQYSAIHHHSKRRRRQYGHRQHRQRQAHRKQGTKGPMTSTAKGYRYYKPDPPPIFKFGIYVTGIVFGSSLFTLTTISLFTNGWPLVSAFVLVPATIVTYQGWSGMNEHRNAAGRNFLQGWVRFLKLLGKGREKIRKEKPS
ncbi:MAG: J domain-containing protein [Flavobacteriales bacterium]